MEDYALRRVCGIDLAAAGWVSMMSMAPGLRGIYSGRQNRFAPPAAGPALAGRATGSRPLSILCQLAEPVDVNLERLVGQVFGSGLEAGCPEAEGGGGAAGELVFEVRGVNRVVSVAPRDLAPHPGLEAEGPCEDAGWYVLRLDLASRLPHAETERESPALAMPGVGLVTVAGSGPSPRVRYRIRATMQKPAADGQRHRRRFTLINRAPRAWRGRPVCLTFDHAAEVGALRSLPDGRDVQLLQDGRVVGRASGDWGSGACKVWGRASLPAARWWQAEDYGAGDGEIRLCDGLGPLPEAGAFVASYDEGSGEVEILRVRRADARRGRIWVDRGLRGTVARPAAADGRLWAVWRQGFWDLLWGHTGVAAGACEALPLPPIFDLAASSNARWVYGAYYEGLAAGVVDARADRGGALVPRALGDYQRERYRGDGDQYWRYVAADLGQPAVAFGLDYRQAGPAAGRDVYDRWDLASAVGICRYEYRWEVTGLRWGNGGTPFRTGRLCVRHVDGSGNAVRARELDLDVTGGTGTVIEEPEAPAYRLSWRIEPYDWNLMGSVFGKAQEPEEGAGFRVDQLVVTMCDGETPVVAAGAGVEEVYQLGTGDLPARLETGAGAVEICGLVLPVGGELSLEAATGAVSDGELDWAHRTRGRVPLLPADLPAYPAEGATALSLTEAGGLGLELRVQHRDVYPT